MSTAKILEEVGKCLNSTHISFISDPVISPVGIKNLGIGFLFSSENQKYCLSLITSLERVSQNLGLFPFPVFFNRNHFCLSECKLYQKGGLCLAHNCILNVYISTWDVDESQ